MEYFEWNKGKKEEKPGKRFWAKRTAAMLLCFCLLLTSADVAAVAAELGGALKRSAPQGEEAYKGRWMTPDVEQPFGAYALSGPEVSKLAGKSVELKVYAWSDQGELTYTWYHPRGYELEEKSDTLKMPELTAGEDSDFGTYKCVVQDGTSKKTIKFSVRLTSTLYVSALSSSYEDRYPGEPLNLSVSAKDYSIPEKTITYQWYQGKKKLEGETGSTLAMANPGKEGEGSTTYRCTVSNGLETVTKTFYVYTRYFENFYVTEEGMDSSIGEYSSVYYKTGSQHTWTVHTDLDNLVELTYQWQKEAYNEEEGRWEMVDIEGATEKSYTFTVGEDGSRLYLRCRISAGQETSRADWYIYGQDEDISGYGQSVISRLHVPASLSVDPHVTQGLDRTKLTYQWYKEGKDGGADKKLEGETTDTLSFSSVTEEDYGTYYCRVSLGETSADLYVFLERYQHSLKQSARYAWPGMPITYEVDRGYVDDPNASYQWYERSGSWVNDEYVYSEKAIEGAVGPRHTAAYAEEDRAVLYLCKVTEFGEDYWTDTSETPYQIAEEGTDWYATGGRDVYYNRAVGDSVTLHTDIVRQKEAPQLEIRWEKEIPEYDDEKKYWIDEWHPLEESGEALEVSYDSLHYGDRYTSPDGGELICYSDNYRAVVSDGEKEEIIKFYITRKDSLTAERVNITMDPYYGGYTYIAEIGESATLEVKANSSIPEAELTYQWQKSVYDPETEERGYVDIEGATEASYRIAAVTEEDYGEYQCLVSDGNQTKEISISVRNYKFSTTGSSNFKGYLGQKDVELTVEASYEKEGAEITYQWYKKDENGKDQPIPGATSHTYHIGLVDKEALGSYTCKITADGKTQEEYFYIWQSDSFYEEGKYLDIGDTVPLVAEVDAPGEEIYYQWKRGTYDYDYDNDKNYYVWEDIAGETSPVYRLEVREAEDFTFCYCCEVTINGVKSEKRFYVNRNAGARGTVERAWSREKTIACELGGKVTLSPIAYCGGHNLSYQWFYADYDNLRYPKPLEGATSPEYTVSLDSPEDYGNYVCRVECETCKDWLFLDYYIVNPEWEHAPEEPKQPEQPEQPKQPEEQKKPEQPKQPEEQKKPEQPKQPEEQKKPEQQKQPEEQKQPAKKTAVKKVSLNKTALTLEKGETSKLTASIQPENATNQKVTWSSSNPKVASVSGGVVKAVGKGSATITVKTADGGKKATCKVKVIIPAKQVFLLKEKNMVKGETFQLSATITPADAEKKVTWKSSNEKVAKVNAKGKVTAQKAGTAKITAVTENGKRAVCKVTVVSKAVKTIKVTLNKKRSTLNAGEKLQLTAKLNPAKSTDALTWKTSNKKVAKVDKNGVVTAQKPGKASITVQTKNGKKAVCEIVVKQPTESIRFEKSSLTLKVGKQQKLKVSVKPGNTTDSITWRTSNKKIVTVSKNGVIKGVRKGKASITVKTSSGKKAVCKVTVK